MNEIEINPQFEQVLNFINHTNQPVFLTGKAGTGKTTLLKYIRQNTFKQLAVVAPTGVAAINAGGSTIHSFFQFPFTPFLPGLTANQEIDYSKNNLPALKYNSLRLNIFRNLELLVIDEISMVRADLLDQIDVTLRQTRKKWQLPFGGVQVLLIGDMYQLPPVVQQEEWAMLSSHYQSPFFFESKVVRNNPLVYIELQKIYRQSEETFIGLLNKVRNNELDEDSLNLLNARYKPNLTQQDYANNITLTTHNRKADEINFRNLQALPGNEFRFKCKTEGTFSDKNYPADDELILKKGTRVMFLKNNTEKNYYNGKIGIVSYVDKETIRVKCEEDKSDIEVGREVWTNVSYSLNKATKHVEEEVLGTFSQVPLRLAWAITIHKSQGLTFDKLIIDAAESFSAGQVYVALSRCRSLKGLTFSSLISRKALLNDNYILHFATTKQNDEQVDTIYQTSRQKYIGNLLHNLFDFSEQLNSRKELGGLMQLYKTRINAVGLEWLVTLFNSIEAIHEVAVKFRNQLSALITAEPEPEGNSALQQRIVQASNYFEVETKKITAQLSSCTLVTESKEISDQFGPELQVLFETLYVKQVLFKSTNKGFVFKDFIKQKLSIVYPDFRISIYASAKTVKTPADIKHPALYRKLLLLRDEICNEEHKPVYLVAANKTLVELCNYLPDESGHLTQITGFGKARADAFGDQFLKIIKEYISQNGLSSNMGAKPPKKNKKPKQDRVEDSEYKESVVGKKPATREVTFSLYKEGLSLPEIAKQRGYTLSTIENHLVTYVANGDIDINKLVEPVKQEQIQKALEKFRYEDGLNPIKSSLPANVSFAEIRYVLAARLMKS